MLDLTEKMKADISAMALPNSCAEYGLRRSRKSPKRTEADQTEVIFNFITWGRSVDNQFLFAF